VPNRPYDMRALGRRLEAHIRLEEKQVFPEIEQAVPEPDLAGLTFGKRTRLLAGGRAGIGVPYEGTGGPPPMPS
jgi:hypothetical protein